MRFVCMSVMALSMVSGAYANEKEIVEIKTEVSETSDVVDATEVVETTEEEAN